MMTTIHSITTFFTQKKRGFIGLCLLCCSQAAIAAENKTYTIGVVPQFEAQTLYNIWQPILDRLHAKTGLNFNYQGSPSIPAFEKDVRAGKFDFAYMNPYQLLKSQQSSAYQPLIKDLERQLYGVLVVRKDSNITNVRQLDQKIVAFPSANALGASLLLRAEIAQKYNIKLIPRYVKTHNSVYFNVYLKQATAGGGVQKTFHQQKSNIRNQLRILFQTQKVTPHPFTAHPRVPNKIQQRIKNAFLEMGETQYDRHILSKIPITKIGRASLTDYEALKHLHLEKFYQEN